MSYQVLARKWRPRTFEEIAGQEHTLRALIHALETKRLHHAYLFTGTRGVGKTTLARILAKCLNCETGIRAKPCCTCRACHDIDSGRFIDLIEVDAASRTKVEDTRELLDNVQYVPTSGRFKIYLIDEVHMLSGHSFNALLKTLEEPPEHVKFLLATTDPQKLPKTVLSRCLQFHLKNLKISYITDYLQQILTKEEIPFETKAIQKIAKSATGSMRDALSLLDQAIAFTHGNINTTDTYAMLGTLEYNHIEKILNALIAQDGKQLLDITAHLAEQGVDFNTILDDLISAFHKIAIHQIVPEAINDDDDREVIQTLSQQLRKEDVQLYYQIALIGRRDLPLATDPQTGFEMTLLRLLTFRPSALITGEKYRKPISPPPITQTDHEALTPPLVPLHLPDWSLLLEKLNLSGMVYTLASNCILHAVHDDHIELILASHHATLCTEKTQTRLHNALNQYFNRKITLTIHIDEINDETPAEQTKRMLDEKHQGAVKIVSEDPLVQDMIDKFGTTIDPKRVELI